MLLLKYVFTIVYFVFQSGSERTEDGDDCDYKALYEASAAEVRRLRALLATSDLQLREARTNITRLSQVVSDAGGLTRGRLTREVEKGALKPETFDAGVGVARTA